ncbi:MAG: IreB family regulatory phosphoprotein [Tepidanaerobacteraceae bacterium]|jgi:uncharacterized protein (UPF0297 family)|nr:IreB family regulatory phosphoprotein [Tepidanaerobacteraceae bacterium]
MGQNFQETMRFNVEKDKAINTREVLQTVYEALKQKGYNPVSQIVGYLLSGDPAYITSFNNARNLIRKLERDELLEELLKYYIEES